jgi:uncharacterized protein with HEPN domain
MLRHIDLAERFARGLDDKGLSSDLQALYAVIRSLEIISEASRRLSDDLKARHPGIPWREMAAAGNFYRHNYEDVTSRRVWQTLREHLQHAVIYVRFSNRPVWVKRFQTIHHFSVDVARGQAWKASGPGATPARALAHEMRGEPCRSYQERQRQQECEGPLKRS